MEPDSNYLSMTEKLVSIFLLKNFFIRSFACSYTETRKKLSITKDKEVLGMIAWEAEAFENKLDTHQQGIAYTQIFLLRDKVIE